MKNRLKRLYNEGKITAVELANAVIKGWITQEDYDEIVAIA